MSADKDAIVKRRREITEKVSSYRQTLMTGLYKACEDTGGHKFYEWTDCSYFNVCGEIVDKMLRECRFCGYREYK